MTPAPGTRTIEILVSPTGQTMLQTRGFAGVSCRQASRFLEQALGASLSDQPTAELHQAAPTQEQARQQTG